MLLDSAQRPIEIGDVVKAFGCTASRPVIGAVFKTIGSGGQFYGEVKYFVFGGVEKDVFRSGEATILQKANGSDPSPEVTSIEDLPPPPPRKS